MSKKNPPPFIDIGMIMSGSISNNRIYGEGVGGIKIGTNIDCEIRGNQIYGNDNGGIEIGENQNSRVSDNEILGENNHGINIRKNLNSVLADNKIFGRSNHGIRIIENVNSMITDNEINDQNKGAFYDQAVEDSVLNVKNLLSIIESLELDLNNKNDLVSSLTIIERDLTSTHPEIKKIKKAYLSAQKILEMVVASAIYNNIPDNASIIDSFMTRMIFLIIIS